MDIVWTEKGKRINEIIVRRPGMRIATFEGAIEIAAKANALLSQHKGTKYSRGQSHITITPGKKSDAFVNLVDAGNRAHALEGTLNGGQGILRAAVKATPKLRKRRDSDK